MEIGARVVEVSDESRVAEARRVAASFGRDLGFDATDAGRAAIVATELATNILKHAGRGNILFNVFDDESGAGLECVALDRGPGIADIAVAMRDGHSTAGSAGTGLGAISRLSHTMEVYSRPAQGVALLARLQKGAPPKNKSSTMPLSGAVNIPMPSEEACGDAWRVGRSASGLSLLVVDGLGHGPLAASASHAAVRSFEAGAREANAMTMDRLHQALRPTRGAAASIVEMGDDGKDVVFIGVGNVSGVVVSDKETRRMVCYNGTLGHALKTIRPFTYPTEGETLVVLASDGLGTSWSFDAYPGLKLRHPTLIAAVLYRDFVRGNDDVTVAVARRRAP